MHYDVFTSSFRSDSGCKYLLVVIDEYSGFIWAFGMRKRSETMVLMKLLIRKIEKKLRMKVSGLQCDESNVGVSALRCVVRRHRD